MREALAEIPILFMIMEVSMPVSSLESKTNPPHFYPKLTEWRTPRKSTHPPTTWLSQCAIRAMGLVVTHMRVPVTVGLLIQVCPLSLASIRELLSPGICATMAKIQSIWIGETDASNIYKTYRLRPN